MPLATNMCVVAFGHVPAADQAGRGPGHPVRPPLLGWPAPVAAPRRDLRDVRHRPVHALQLAPRHQPRRDGPPGRRRAQPDLRVRHPLALEERGRGGRDAVHLRRRRAGACRRPPGSASSPTGTPWSGCTSSTWPAGSATGTTPATCAVSSPATSAPFPAGNAFHARSCGAERLTPGGTGGHPAGDTAVSRARYDGGFRHRARDSASSPLRAHHSPLVIGGYEVSPCPPTRGRSPRPSARASR